MAESLIYPDIDIVEIVVMDEADDGLAPPPDPAMLSRDNHAVPEVSPWSAYGPNHGIGAFMSLNPPQPVLLFADALHADQFQAKHALSTRLVPGKNTHWLYINAPTGLERVYSVKEHHEQGETVPDGEGMTGTDEGEFVFEFGKENEAKLFNREIGNVGTVLKKDERGGVWNVFVGKF
ncbi:putative Ras-related protein [Venturia nashicola]|nr:putative Ras-related protein [Venturia nashicola]